MKLSKSILAFALLCTTSVAALAAESGEPIKIGILSDMSGPYSQIVGPGSVAAAKLAVEDVGGSVLGRPIEVIMGDHQHKPDLGASIARRWFDQDGVRAIFDIYNSGVALAVQQLAESKDRILVSTVNSGALTGKSCSPNGMQWGPDGHALANITVKGVEGDKPKSWYFLTVDYTAGHSLEQDSRRAVEKLGGSWKGAVRFPLGTTDFSSYLLQAQASKADSIGFAGGGSDLLNAVKQVNEFQIGKSGQRFVTTSLTTADIRALGGDVTAGFPVVFSFYWGLSPETEKWSERFKKAHGSLPTDMQADTYSAVLHYLKSVQAAGTVETKAVLEKMKATPVNDMFTKDARVRADGRLMRAIYFGTVKPVRERKNGDDLIAVEKEFSGEEAFLPREQSECPLLK